MSGKNSRLYLIVGVTILALLAGVVSMISSRNVASPAGLSAPSGVKVEGARVVPPAQAPETMGIVVIKSSKNDVTPPLRDMPVLSANRVGPEETERNNPPLPTVGHVDAPDPIVQRTVGANASINIAAPTLVFEGINRAGGCGNCAPPDTNGDVGPNHYVQAVNSSFAIYNKSGTLLYGPAAINTIWAGFGGPCQTRNDGDPIVLYDSISDRWLISQFTAASPYNECIAISQTGDPTGAWYRYAFQLSTADFPDYPKFGVWPDGYYMSVNWFVNGASYGGPRPYAFDRAKMLLGQPATLQTTSSALGSSVAPIMPADLDGPTLPAAGSPELFIGFGSTMKMYKFAVNWTTPSLTTWTNFANLTAAAYTTLCPTNACVPQQGTNQKLDGIGDRLMTRVVYRNMTSYESLLALASVDAGTRKAPQAGVRWYEIRNPLGTPSIYQQGTYAPADGLYRWMGSIAMDKNGAIALGYSGSSSTSYPSIRYTARLSTSPLGTMDQGEGLIYQGTGYQSGVNRWGDYSNLSVDPVDDCTFWYTTEYNNSGGWGWGTKIGSFRVANCP